MTLYEVLAGKHPFEADDITAVMQRIVSVMPPPLEPQPGRSADLDAIVLRALAKSPDERFASARELALALGRSDAGCATVRQRAGRPPREARLLAKEPSRSLPCLPLPVCRKTRRADALPRSSSPWCCCSPRSP